MKELGGLDQKQTQVLRLALLAQNDIQVLMLGKTAVEKEEAEGK